jgi:hypothetical protein
MHAAITAMREGACALEQVTGAMMGKAIRQMKAVTHHVV